MTLLRVGLGERVCLLTPVWALLVDLLSQFVRITGIGGVLNTSFNIHGFPIVRTADDALNVLDKTDIDGVVIGRTAILKKERTSNDAGRGGRVRTASTAGVSC